ncbi:MAG: hypothetical protein RLZZ507_4060 [Cyanobacteriota bacterium]|jgi:hypothetical protein
MMGIEKYKNTRIKFLDKTLGFMSYVHVHKALYLSEICIILNLVMQKHLNGINS